MKFKLNENSNKFRRLKRALFGDVSGKIRTFAIISPQNPLGWKNSSEEEFKKKFSAWTTNKSKYNSESLSRMKSEILSGIIMNAGNKALSAGHFDYVQIKGSYGQKEKTLVVFNLSLDDAKILARNYGQESFFYGRTFSEDKTSEIGYYLTLNSCQSYKLKEISNVISDEEDAEDFFSKFGFKFRINMNSFEDNITPVVNDGFFDESLSDENSTFSHRAFMRINSRSCDKI